MNYRVDRINNYVYLLIMHSTAIIMLFHSLVTENLVVTLIFGVYIPWLDYFVDISFKNYDSKNIIFYPDINRNGTILVIETRVLYTMLITQYSLLLTVLRLCQCKSMTLTFPWGDHSNPLRAVVLLSSRGIYIPRDKSTIAVYPVDRRPPEYI